MLVMKVIARAPSDFSPILPFTDPLTEFIRQTLCGDTRPMQLDVACLCPHLPGHASAEYDLMVAYLWPNDH